MNEPASSWDSMKRAGSGWLGSEQERPGITNCTLVCTQSCRRIVVCAHLYARVCIRVLIHLQIVHTAVPYFSTLLLSSHIVRFEHTYLFVHHNIKFFFSLVFFLLLTGVFTMCTLGNSNIFNVHNMFQSLSLCSPGKYEQTSALLCT